MSDLLPCPFCGGEPERIEIADEGINSGGSCIGCKQCGACSPVHFDRKENLDDSWNRRASPPAGRRPDYARARERMHEVFGPVVARPERMEAAIIARRELISKLMIAAFPEIAAPPPEAGNG